MVTDRPKGLVLSWGLLRVNLPGVNKEAARRESGHWGGVGASTRSTCFCPGRQVPVAVSRESRGQRGRGGGRARTFLGRTDRCHLLSPPAASWAATVFTQHGGASVFFFYFISFSRAKQKASDIESVLIPSPQVSLDAQCSPPVSSHNRREGRSRLRGRLAPAAATPAAVVEAGGFGGAGGGAGDQDEAPVKGG